jgi:hypothetical protein
MDSICNDISVANTLPLLPTYFAAVMAGSPIPVAMSRTLEPGLISASSINRLLTFSVPPSIVLPLLPTGSYAIPTLTFCFPCIVLNQELSSNFLFS